MPEFKIDSLERDRDEDRYCRCWETAPDKCSMCELRERLHAREAEIAQLRADVEHWKEQASMNVFRRLYLGWKERAEAAEARLARVRALSAVFASAAEDAKARGYLEAWNTYQVCKNHLDAALADPPAVPQREASE